PSTSIYPLSLHDALPIYRAAPDRGARRSQTARRRRPVRPPVLLLELAAGAPAREPVARQGSAPVAQPVADLGRLRAPALLPALRARFLRADAQALPQGGQDPAHRRGGRARARRGHLPRDRDGSPGRGRRHARGDAREAHGGNGAGGAPRCLSSTSRPPSTTRTASRTWGTPSRRSARTASRATTGCAATTSTS